MPQLFANNAESTLLNSVTNVALSLQVAAGHGARFPVITGGDFFLCTLYKVTGNVESAIEIVRVTARTADTFTIVRAQEGTTALAYAANDSIQLRQTAGTYGITEAHLNNVANPHATTKAQVGLALVDNTADSTKPVSTAQAAADAAVLAAAAPIAHVGSGGTSHAAVVAAGASGFMTGADKTKLDGVATGATANTGTVTTASVVTANGFAGTVATPSTTPAITLTTNVVAGLVKSTGTALAAAALRTDYAEPTTALATGLLKNTTSTGAHTIAVAGTDFQAPIGTISGLVKGNGANALIAAVVRTDYAEPTTALATGILRNTTGSGALTIAVAGDFPVLNQNTTGNAATVTTNANLTGAVTSVGNTASLGSFTLSQLNIAISDADVATGGGTATGTNTGDNAINSTYAADYRAANFVVRTNYAEPTTALATGILRNTTVTGAHTIATGADLPTMTSTVGGAVPTPPNNTTTFLRGDGTFAVPAGGGGGVTSVSGTAPVVSSGGATPAISMPAATGVVDGFMTAAFAAKLNGIAAGATNVTNTNQLSNGSGYVTSSGVTSITVSAPLTGGSISSTGSIGIPTAAAGVTGALSGTDWTTFNNKQAAIGYTPYNQTNPSGYTSNTGTVTTVSVATANGVSGSVATAGTTPAITLALGAITPSSIACSGTISGTDVTATSDERLKTEWSPVQNNLVENLAKVRSGSYRLLDKATRSIGASAQGIQQIMPEAVFQDDDGYLSLAYGNAALVACIELAKEVQFLKSEIAALRAA